ncbi:MAG TPA: EpsG family protein [Allosphingosinicella sp.]|jgi:hypothetical protein|nr:EpsG family protein [Allosphingosinicella sp.]
MYPYWILFLVFALGTIQTRSGTLAAAHGGVGLPAAPQRLLLGVAVVLMALMIGFRYEVGGDWLTYLWMYDDIQHMSLFASLTRTDPGYGVLNWISSELGTDIWGVNLVCGALFCFGLFRFAKGQPHPWLAILVGVPYLVIGVGMGYTRQAVAIGLAMCGFAAIAQGSLPRFLFWVLLAATFHRTAVVLIPIVGLAFSRNRLQTLLLSGLAVVVGYFVLLAPAMDQFTRGYIDQVYEAQGAGIRLAMNLVPAVLFLLLSKKLAPEPSERAVWRNVSIVALGAYVGYFFVASTVIVDRLALYVIPLQLFVLSRLPSAFAVKGLPSRGMLMLVIAYCAAVQFVWLNFSNHSIYWIPYKVYPVISGPDAASSRY